MTDQAVAIDKLEAVDAEEHGRQTALARHRAELDGRQEWLQSRGRIRAELDRLRDVFGGLVSSDLRMIRHHATGSTHASAHAGSQRAAERSSGQAFGNDP